MITTVEPAVTHVWYSEHRVQRRLLDQFGDDHAARNRLLSVFRRAVRTYPDPKLAYRAAVQDLIGRYEAAKRAGKTKRMAQWAALLQLLKQDKVAAFDLLLNQVAWVGLSPDERQRITAARKRAYDLAGIPRCAACGGPLCFPESQELGRCVTCRAQG